MRRILKQITRVEVPTLKIARQARYVINAVKRECDFDECRVAIFRCEQKSQLKTENLKKNHIIQLSSIDACYFHR